MSQFDWGAHPIEGENKSSKSFSWEDHPVETKTPEEGSSVLKTIGKIGDAIDSVTGAPTRAAIGALQDGENPISAFASNFAGDPRKAPTGKEIATKAGIDDTNPALKFKGSTAISAVENLIPGGAGLGLLARMITPSEMKDHEFEPTKADLAGSAIDVLGDYSNFVPLGAIARGAGKSVELAGKGAKLAGEAVSPLVHMIPGGKAATSTASVVADGVANAAKAIDKAFSPSRAADFNDLLKIAEKNKIDPSLLNDTIEFGKDSFISRAARNKAEGPLGEASLKKYNEGRAAIQDALSKKISEIGGGAVPSQVEAGELIRSGYDKAVDDLFENVGMTHGKVMDAIPGLQLSPSSVEAINSKLNGIEKFAKGRAERGITGTAREQAKQLLNAVDAVRAGNGSYKQTVEALRDVGEVAFKSSNSLADVPPDIQKFRDLYFTLDNALIDTVEKAAGKEVANELRDSNKVISEFLGDKSKVAHIIGNKNMAPEKVFQSLIEQGDTTKIEALKKILPPETFNKLKASFLESQIKRGADETFSFKGLHNSLRNKKNIVGQILNPSEVGDVTDLIHLGDRYGDPVLSYSGTGASNVFRDVGQAVRSSVENDSVVNLLKEKARAKESNLAQPITKAYSDKVATRLSSKVGHEAQLAANEIESNSPNFNSEKKLIKKNESNAQALRLLPLASKLSLIGKDDPNVKGPVKWVFNGMDRVQEHGANLSEDQLVSLSESKNGRNLLIQASDLKPNTKAMDDVIKKIKMELKQNG